jgi:trimeric autotransporter adhesin
MASTYVNDLRLNEMATGDGSGTWGTTTNTNLELIAEAFSYGTEAITTNADTHTTTIADGATDPGRSMYLKYTGTLDSACTITIGPNTVSKVWIIENGTSGSQDIILSQGSGANITIPAGDTKVVYSDGAGAGAAFFDAFASLSVVDLKVQDDLTVTDAALVTGVLTTTATQVATGGITSGSDIISDTDSTDSLGSTGVRWLKGWFDTLTAGTLTVGSGSVTDSSGAISFGNENLTTTGIVTAAGTSVFTNLDISGDIDVDGTTETDVLTINGSQFNYKAFGTDSIMIGDTTTGTIDAADRNTGLGVDVFADLTTGDDNTGVGKGALNANTTGNNNTGVGRAALGNNTTASNNTAVGYYALLANTEGADNTATGTQALQINTTGESNSAFGRYALLNNTTASNNTAVGRSSLQENTTGASNTGVGYQALYVNTEGANNVAVGIGALKYNTTGATNTALGSEALNNNTTASNNVAIGVDALYTNTTGASNVAVGRSALVANTTGADNTAIGYDALGDNTTAAGNTAVGHGSLAAATEGGSNTAIGYNAGGSITTGQANLCLGYNAGDYQATLTTGIGNVLVGPFCDAVSATANDQHCFGYNLDAASGYTTLGAGSNDIRAAFGVATWATVSDERYKKDIVDSTTGLSFINALRPRTFKYKNLGELPETFRAYEADSTEVFKNPNTNHGFIAQEIKAAIDADDSIKDGFKLWDDREDGSQEVAEAALIPVLVKAIQELSAQNAELTTRIEALEG